MLHAGISPSVPFLTNPCLSTWTLSLLTAVYRLFHSNCICGSSSVSCSIVSKLVHLHRDSPLPPRGLSLYFSCLDPDLHPGPPDYEAGTLLTGLGRRGFRIAVKAQSTGNELCSQILDQSFPISTLKPILYYVQKRLCLKKKSTDMQAVVVPKQNSACVACNVR